MKKPSILVQPACNMCQMFLQLLRKSGARSRSQNHSSPLWTWQGSVAIALHLAWLTAHRSRCDVHGLSAPRHWHAWNTYYRKLPAHQPSVLWPMLMQHMSQLRESSGSEETPGFKIWKSFLLEYAYMLLPRRHADPAGALPQAEAVLPLRLRVLAAPGRPRSHPSFSNSISLSSSA